MQQLIHILTHPSTGRPIAGRSLAAHFFGSLPLPFPFPLPLLLLRLPDFPPEESPAEADAEEDDLPRRFDRLFLSFVDRLSDLIQPDCGSSSSVSLMIMPGGGLRRVRTSIRAPSGSGDLGRYARWSNIGGWSAPGVRVLVESCRAWEGGELGPAVAELLASELWRACGGGGLFVDRSGQSGASLGFGGGLVGALSGQSAVSLGACGGVEDAWTWVERLLELAVLSESLDCTIASRLGFVGLRCS